MYNIIESLTLIFAGLKQAIASNRHMPQPRIALLERVWLHVHGMRNRLERLYTRWRNGTLPKPGTRGRARATPATSRPAVARLPRGRGWLVRDTQAVVGARSQLAHFLATHPDIPAFLEAAPQAGRILRPLCHMFGIKLEAPLGPKLDHLAAIAKPPPRRPRPAAAPTPAPTPATPAKRRRPAPPTAPPVFSSP